ncbi:hypothetical protein HUG10_17480 [Halorarum halophilum]|uniref:Uncharacterized protein n=1 Tax=Halorarum halophilum TaxID=2743090 RepID=A0A7D5GHI7_9EURY|nr:hypothetical protein [Halobaculum halophilum]QLG29210.1 hypothetical protein HUG10_17480 [Halobaculum halophilum]
MNQRRTRAFGAWQLVWAISCAVIAGVMVSTHQRPLPTLERAFFVWFLGFLVSTELFSPRHASPGLWRRLRWIVFAGALVVAFITAQAVAEVLA